MGWPQTIDPSGGVDLLGESHSRWSGYVSFVQRTHVGTWDKTWDLLHDVSEAMGDTSTDFAPLEIGHEDPNRLGFTAPILPLEAHRDDKRPYSATGPRGHATSLHARRDGSGIDCLEQPGFTVRGSFRDDIDGAPLVGFEFSRLTAHFNALDFRGGWVVVDTSRSYEIG